MINNTITRSKFESTKADVVDRNKKALMSMGVGAALGVGVTAISPRSSVSSTVVTAAYAGVRVYLTHERMEQSVERDTNLACRDKHPVEMTKGDMAATALGGLIDVTAVGYLSSFLLGN